MHDVFSCVSVKWERGGVCHWYFPFLWEHYISNIPLSLCGPWNCINTGLCISTLAWGTRFFFPGVSFTISICSFIKLCREFREFHCYCSSVFFGGSGRDHGSSLGIKG